MSRNRSNKQYLRDTLIFIFLVGVIVTVIMLIVTNSTSDRNTERDLCNQKQGQYLNYQYGPDLCLIDGHIISMD